MRCSEAIALAHGSTGPFTRIEVTKEVRKDLSITQQGREMPSEDITRIRYLNDTTEMEAT